MEGAPSVNPVFGTSPHFVDVPSANVSLPFPSATTGVLTEPAPGTVPTSTPLHNPLHNTPDPFQIINKINCNCFSLVERFRPGFISSLWRVVRECIELPSSTVYQYTPDGP